jgi:small-conductance mechanosensitive channel
MIGDSLRRWWGQLGVNDWLLEQGDLSRWLIAAALLVVLITSLRIAQAVLGRRARKLAEKPGFDYAQVTADLIEATRFLFLVLMSASLSSLVLPLSDQTQTIIRTATIIVLLIQAGIWGHVAVTFFVTRFAKQRLGTDATSVTTISALGMFARLAIISVVVLLILDNLGVNVTTMVAGLGIGGIAVALAAQNILGDLFASASIVLDKPFVMGDFVVVGGDFLGTVEHVGLKTTRIRSLSGEQLVFSNNDLLQSRIRNFKRMLNRRIVFSIGVIYQTPYDKLAAIAGILRAAVEAQEHVRFDRAHFKEHGDFSLNFEVVYHVLSPDFNVYMDIQQAINLTIHKRFEEQEIEFAYPTQTILLPERDLARRNEIGEAGQGVAIRRQIDTPCGDSVFNEFRLIRRANKGFLTQELRSGTVHASFLLMCLRVFHSTSSKGASYALRDHVCSGGLGHRCGGPVGFSGGSGLDFHGHSLGSRR